MATQVASVVAEIGANTSGFEQGMAKVKSGLGDVQSKSMSLVPGLEKIKNATGSWMSQNTGLLSTLGLVAAGTTMVVNAVNEAVNATIKYAGEVRDLSAIGGTSAESASRFIQVLDDYQLTAQDATAATRFLTKNGLTPTIETLAQLSDQYRAIQDPMEKNEFVLQKLGRGGMQWINVLNQGGDALRQQGAAVSSNLVLTQKQVDAAEKARLAQDAWSDAVMGFKVAASNAFLPTMTSMMNVAMGTEDLISKYERLSFAAKNAAGQGATFAAQRELDALKQTAEYTELATKAINDYREGEREASMDVRQATLSIDEQKAALDAQKAAIEEATRVNAGYLSSIQSTADEQAGFMSRVSDLYAKRDALEKNFADGKIRGKKGLEEYNQQIKEITDQLNQEAAAHLKVGNAAIIQQLQEKLTATGGGLDEGETRFIEDQMVKRGLATQTAIEAVRTQRAEVDALVNSYMGLGSVPIAPGQVAPPPGTTVTAGGAPQAAPVVPPINTAQQQAAVSALTVDTTALVTAQTTLNNSMMQVTTGGLAVSNSLNGVRVSYLDLGNSVMMVNSKLQATWNLLNQLNGMVSTAYFNLISTGGVPRMPGVTSVSGGGGTTVTVTPGGVNVNGMNVANIGHAKGTDMIVPPGYGNDNYPMFFQSGERVIAIPQGQPGNNGSLSPTGAVRNSINISNINVYLNGNEANLENFLLQLGVAL